MVSSLGSSPPRGVDHGCDNSVDHGCDNSFDSSGDEESLTKSCQDLPPEAWLQPTADHVAILARRAKRFQRAALKLKSDRDSVKAALDAERSRLNDFESQCESHVQMQERCQHLLEQRIESLEDERTDLKVRSDQQDVEEEDVLRRSAEADAHQAETEIRIQKLMDQMVKLLAGTPSADAARSQISQVLEELQASEQRLQRQLQSLQEQHQGARVENRRSALVLSEEQQRTKKLHDTLCELQSELFRTDRGRRNSRRPDPSLAGPSKPSEDLRALLAQPEVEAEAEVAAGVGLRPDTQLSATEAAVGPGHAQEERQLPRSAHASMEMPVAPVESATPKGTQAPGNVSLEEKLRQVLEVVQFENLVIRIAAGLYQFGDSVSAFVQMREDGQLYASEDQVRYEQLEDFIRRITVCPSPPVASAPPATPVQSPSEGRSGTQVAVADDPVSSVRAAADAIIDKVMDSAWTAKPLRTRMPATVPGSFPIGGHGHDRPCRRATPSGQSASNPQQDICAQHQDGQSAMPTPPGPLQAGRKAWSPPPPRAVATMARVARVRSPMPRKGQALDDAGNRQGGSLEMGRNSNPRSPQVLQRTVRGSGPTTRQCGATDKRNPPVPQLTLINPPGQGPQGCMTSPPRRAASPTGCAAGAFVQNALGGSTVANYAGGFGSCQLPPGIMHAASSVGSTPPRELSPTPLLSSRATTPTEQHFAAPRAGTPRDMPAWRRQQPPQACGATGMPLSAAVPSMPAMPTTVGRVGRPQQGPTVGAFASPGRPGLQLASSRQASVSGPVPWQLAGSSSMPSAPTTLSSQRTASASPTRMIVPGVTPGMRPVRR